MYFRNLLITCLMVGLVIPALADPGQEDLVEAVINPGTETSAPQNEEMTPDVLESVTTYPATEVSTETSQIEIGKPETSESAESHLKKDVILVLDNSGSMKKNDPQFLTKQAVTEFINKLDELTRVAIVIFDQDVRMAVPLTEITSASRQGLLDSLSKINYRGLYTNSPAAVESAIYDLKNNGREDARKIIVFMTDGIVDTGSVDRDLEKTKWLKEDLAADAADAGIKIFGIAFTENADFELIQSLAQKTDGEYYRALMADDLQNVFSKLNTLINKPDEPEVIEQPKIIETVVEKIIERVIEPAPAPEPIIIEVPVGKTQLEDEAERKRSMLILVALAVLILAVIAMVLMLLKGSKNRSRDEETAQEAYLNDIHGVTGQAAYALGNQPTMLGRVAGKDTEYLNYFVIPETTIGRRHALIEYKDFSYWIIDQGSINGTFVNDKAATSEVRLKHGDKIRLHKIEFEFVMPEMADTGMTVIANQGISSSVESTLKPGSVTPESNYDELDDDLPEPDFDITDTADDSDAVNELDEDEEDTLMSMKEKMSATEGPDGSDETIMLDDDSENDVMDGCGDDDATIRPDS